MEPILDSLPVPYFQDDSVTLYCGDIRQVTPTLGSVQCIVTSPPYWGLRDYGVDGQLGLEKTPEAYVSNLVSIFHELRRVLRDDGTLWINLGDSYCGSGKGADHKNGTTAGYKQATNAGSINVPVQDWDVSGLKPKDLVGIPWMVAKALQSPYYAGKVTNELDRVWLAATIDAEGTICGFTHERKDNGDTRHGIHTTITNSNLALLGRCFEIWPTTREEHNQHSDGHLGHLPTWRWIVHGIDQKSDLLRELYPYFVAKKRQALLAWNFLEISRVTRGRNKGDEGNANREKYAWIVDALSRLNHLESVDIPPWCKEPPSMYEPGWWLRQDIIWAKPNPMPESVTDRCTKSHEYVFLLSKSARYYMDMEAIKESSVYGGYKDAEAFNGKNHQPTEDPKWGGKGTSSRNRRSVWTVSTQPYAGAHFATFPPDLIRPCILAGTSEKGCCPSCGKPWVRIIEKGLTAHDGETGCQYEKGTTANRLALLRQAARERGQEYTNESKTIGWQPQCSCGGEPIPCTVLDPFAGSGTTGEVAKYEGRRAVLVELKKDYCELAKKRIQKTPTRMILESKGGLACGQ